MHTDTMHTSRLLLASSTVPIHTKQPETASL